MRGKIIGLTGGIGTGKSTVSQMLRDLGAFVVDADVWARRVVEPGSDGLRDIVEVFGEDVLQPDGTLDRKKLGAIVFRDEEKRLQLNRIVHPRVQQGMWQETTDYWRDHPGEPVVWDVPLLIEGTAKRLVDEIVVVYASPATQLRRVMERDGLSEEEALRRIQAQMPIDEKRAVATYVIENDGPLEFTREQVQALWQKLRAESRSGPSSCR
ncbi:dephospho-CoA kinase [Alicyclobacillus acidocaldarius]|uniref:Dephospho-CoA kinase n=1 Tax=Alicyclobacillus acidocaldarius (strain Tc-4-1) TaxID=1048834 RepID=F8II41_ALIAT|nr:dephospho-CoA kinase [Alicyclobacillus acidocaldarius]AEJ44521.1 dephospho-CoA kinase [Alicyclobacillus acidocaldarius subsp. acidocaldarius Tc-4-1]